MSHSRRSSSAGAIALAIALMAGPAPAQAPTEPGIVIVDQERMFQQSLFGRRIRDEIDRRSAALAAENREIEEVLTTEERALTEQRPRLSTEAFRLRAAAFDEKVRRIRTEQDAKARALSRVQEEARQEFARRVGPVLSELLDEIGAAIVLDRRVVLAAAADADITDAAIARIDDAVGTGAAGARDDPAASPSEESGDPGE